MHMKYMKKLPSGKLAMENQRIFNGQINYQWFIQTVRNYQRRLIFLLYPATKSPFSSQPAPPGRCGVVAALSYLVMKTDEIPDREQPVFSLSDSSHLCWLHL